MSGRSVGMALVLIAGGMMALSAGRKGPDKAEALPAPVAEAGRIWVDAAIRAGTPVEALRAQATQQAAQTGQAQVSPSPLPDPDRPPMTPPLASEPDLVVRPALTPGATWSSDKEKVCGTRTSEVRNVPRSVRSAVIVAYGSPTRGTFVIDHLVPLGVGGSNEFANLWPEPVGLSKLKDVCENRARSMVCSRGTLTIAEAQRGFSTDWKAFCRSIGVAGVQ